MHTGIASSVTRVSENQPPLIYKFPLNLDSTSQLSVCYLAIISPYVGTSFSAHAIKFPRMNGCSEV